MRLTIDKLVHGGAGLGAAGGKRIFVPLSAPGDTLDVEIEADHGDWAEARICSVLDPSPLRVEPHCPVFGRCGGCQWQHLSYEAQLDWKRSILCETLERIGQIPEPRVLATLPSPCPWHYRNRIQLHVDGAGRVGFYRARSQEVVEFEACAIADERLNAMLARRRPELAQRDRGIALRVEEEEGSFSQINSAQNERLRKAVVEWMSGPPHRSVLELHAGSGNFTFAIAKTAERVLASDVDCRAIHAAKAKQLREGVCNVEFMCVPADRALARAEGRLGGTCDAVLLDPPRKGCAEAVEGIAVLHPASILYISCDPATLARDARALVERGYHFVKSLPVDMFPQTSHIESLTLFKGRV